MKTKLTVDVEIVQKVSKNGNNYSILEITFSNGYKWSSRFLSDEQIYCLRGSGIK